MNRWVYRTTGQSKLAAGGFYQARAKYRRRSDWKRRP